MLREIVLGAALTAIACSGHPAPDIQSKTTDQLRAARAQYEVAFEDLYPDWFVYYVESVENREFSEPIHPDMPRECYKSIACLSTARYDREKAKNLCGGEPAHFAVFQMGNPSALLFCTEQDETSYERITAELARRSDSR